MAEDYSRTKGIQKGYKFAGNEGGGDTGPYIGVVKNNVDATRSGRLQVYIEQFAGQNPEDASNWRTVSYLPPFYGSTNNLGAGSGTGQFILNKHSYGMWFTPPDLETKVLCFFVAGSATNGYYVGCIPDDSLTHMVPAIGATDKFDLSGNEKLQSFTKGAKQLPVVEINNKDRTINDNPRFYDQDKPVHSVLAGVLHQQGLITDTIRGPITSSSHRESPSNVFGFSTPGRPIYRSGIQDDNVEAAARNLGGNKTAFEVIGRSGGHSIVMDDGDVKGKNNLIRIRTDQEINIKQLLSDLKSNSSDKILVPSIHYENNIYQISDFYFGGDLKLITNFFECASKYHFDNSPHINPILAFAKEKALKDLSMSEDVLSYSKGSLQYNFLQNHVIKHNFFPFTKEIYSKIKWRGEDSDIQWKKGTKNKFFRHNFKVIQQFKISEKQRKIDSFFYSPRKPFWLKLIRKIVEKLHNYV